MDQFVYSQGEASGSMPLPAISTEAEILLMQRVYAHIQLNNDDVVLLVRQQTIEPLQSAVGADIYVTDPDRLQGVMDYLYKRQNRSIALVLSAEVDQLPQFKASNSTIMTNVHRCVRNTDKDLLGLKITPLTNTAPRNINYHKHIFPTDVSDNASEVDWEDNVSDDVSEDSSEEPDQSANENVDEDINEDANTDAKSTDWGSIAAASAGALVGAGVAVGVGAAALPAAGLVAASSLVAGALYHVPWRNLFVWKSSLPGEDVYEKSQPPASPTSGHTSETEDSRTTYPKAGAVIVLYAVLVVAVFYLGLGPAASMVASWLVSTLVMCIVPWATIYGSIGSEWTSFKSNLWSVFSTLKKKLPYM